MKFPWDQWVGTDAGRVVMRIKRLASFRGRNVDLHGFVGADEPGCYHTHPARAVRVVLWGGYVEELEDGTRKTWRPGMVGLIRPELSHRVAELRNGRFSLSLWIRGRCTHPINLRGSGWGKPLCASCGNALTDDEQHYYGATCETCEGQQFHAEKAADVIDFEALRAERNRQMEALRVRVADELGVPLQEARTNFNPSACYCACGTRGPCEHSWDGPEWESDDGLASSSTCSRCGCTAMSHDLRNAF